MQSTPEISLLDYINDVVSKRLHEVDKEREGQIKNLKSKILELEKKISSTKISKGSNEAIMKLNKRVEVFDGILQCDTSSYVDELDIAYLVQNGKSHLKEPESYLVQRVEEMERKLITIIKKTDKIKKQLEDNIETGSDKSYIASKYKNNKMNLNQINSSNYVPIKNSQKKNCRNN